MDRNSEMHGVLLCLQNKMCAGKKEHIALSAENELRATHELQVRIVRFIYERPYGNIFPLSLSSHSKIGVREVGTYV